VPPASIPPTIDLSKLPLAFVVTSAFCILTSAFAVAYSAYHAP
jgi:hypothetical protein